MPNQDTGMFSLAKIAVTLGRHTRTLGNSSECVSEFHAPDYGASSLTSTDAPLRESPATEQVGGTGFQQLNPGLQNGVLCTQPSKS